LLQQQKGIVPGTTLRVAGSKAGQTQLIQIAGNSTRPSQFAMAQGKNFVSVTPQQQQQQRLLTTQAGTIVKNAELKSSNTGTVAVASTNPSNVIVSNNSQSVGGDQQQFKIIHAPNQQHHIQQQQQQFVGVQNVIGGKMKTTGIRWVVARR
jgi:16S rRNA G966 N2-methylase RsmD